MYKKFTNLQKLSSYLTYTISLAFKKYPGIYFLILGSIFSIIAEFSSIYLVTKIANLDRIKIYDITILITPINFLLLFVGLLLLRFISLFLIESLSIYYAKELQVYFSTTAFDKILHINLKTTEKEEVGHYISFAGDEASNASQIIISFITILNNIILILAYFLLIMIYSYDLLLFIFTLLLLLLISFKQIYTYTFYLSELQASLRRKSNSIFIDSINSLRMIKAFSIEDHMTEKYKNILQPYCTVNSKLTTLNIFGKYFPLVILLVFFLVYYYIILCSNYTLTIASIMTSLFILLRLLQALGVLASTFGKILGELKGTIRIIDFLNKKIPHVKTKKIEERINSIIFDNISFFYGKSAVFQNFNFQFERKKSYAIVGRTGSGKSTLLDLIMDFNTPTKGKVFINGVSTHELDEKSLANRILYISQESIVFNDTIRNNLEINQYYTQEQIEKSLKICCLHDSVAALDNGLEHMLHYRGTNLSGGEKQRLNIARALLREPDVLILDESVNALDEKTRHQLVKNIISEFQDKILIFVTHDKDILTFVDTVIDLDNFE